MKLRPLASAAAIAMACALASQAQATTFQVSFGDTTSAPTFNRALADFSDLSGIGTDVHYSTYTFTAATSGDYIFNTTAAFDSFVFLYEGMFDPSDATANGVAANDDLIFGNSLYASGFEVALTAGTSYTYVVTGYGLPDFGVYSTTIAGPAPVPEPQTYLMMALGLVGLVVLRRRHMNDR